MFIMKKVDMYGVLRVQIDDGAQNGPGHLLKIFFVKRGMITQFHIYSLAYRPSQVCSVICMVWEDVFCWIQKCIQTSFRSDLIWSDLLFLFFLEKKTYHYITPKYYYHFDVIFYSRVSFWNKVVTWHLYKITVDPHKHKKMSGYVNVYT